MVGQKLRELREKTGMNKKEFAEYLGLKYTTYNNYETEAREPASDFLILISDRFDVSIDYLLGRKEEQAVLHSYQLKASEYALIEKYRSLDLFGQETVNIVIDRESDRAEQIASVSSQIAVLEGRSGSRAYSDAELRALSIDEKVDLYRQELEREEKVVEESEAS